MSMKRIVYIVLCAIVTAMAVGGCKTANTVSAVVAVRSDSTAITRHDSSRVVAERHDSAQRYYIHDSVKIERWHRDVVAGDSVVHAIDSVVREVVRYVDREHKVIHEVRDTIRLNNTDTVTVTHEVPVEVEIKVPVEVDKSPFLRKSGIALWVIIGLLLVGAIVGVVIKFAK